MEARAFKGIFPGSFTMGNLVCGFIAIVSAAGGELVTACWLIVLAGFFDALDGKVARFSGAASPFGIQLDSLADVVSFGTAPAFIIYLVIPESLGKWSWIICVVYLIAASYRLARYNLHADNEEKKGFWGLPVPGAGITLAAYIIFCNEIWGEVHYIQYLVAMVLLFALLMVSQVEYDSLPDHLNTPQNKIKIAVFTVCAIAALIKPKLLLFPIFAAYIMLGLVREGYRYFYLGFDFVRRGGNRKDEEKE